MKKAIFIASLCLLVGCREGTESGSTRSDVIAPSTIKESSSEDASSDDAQYSYEKINSSETRAVWKRESFGAFSVEKIEHCYFNTPNPRFDPKTSEWSEDGVRTCNWDFSIKNGLAQWAIALNVTAYEGNMDVAFVDVTGDGKKELESVDRGIGDGVGSMTRYFQLVQNKWQKLLFAPANSAKFPVTSTDLVDYIPNDLGTEGGPPEIQDGLLKTYGQGPCDPASDNNTVFFRWNGRVFKVDHWDFDGQIMEPSRNPRCPLGYSLR